ncbi:hypothetical protein [Lactobacillus sp. LL6]|uniref:hypothetical protein n=1 Tax=Lactobacillus sp. LL6 TaxID=2596827 RepID=UPI0011848094|nr:hypothetical protein [Lactobacillus sp. LL6]TSO25355.1 hypothetical protein FOD82_08980 [Lactobacillus sp. LL6]
MKDIESNVNSTKRILYKKILYKFTMLFIAILFVCLSELIMLLGISKIRNYYLWIGDSGSALALGACILILVFINTLIVVFSLQYVFKDTKISKLFHTI